MSIIPLEDCKLVKTTVLNLGQLSKLLSIRELTYSLAYQGLLIMLKPAQ